MSFDQKAYDRERWKRIAADPEKKAAYLARTAARRNARIAANPEWHERKKAYLRDYHKANKSKHVAKTAEWRKRNPGKRAHHHRKERYFLSADDYHRMVAEQGWKCALCRKAPCGNGRMATLRVDHCHASGKVRALLCHKCNAGLGMFGDDSALVFQAAMYLASHAERIRESA